MLTFKCEDSHTVLQKKMLESKISLLPEIDLEVGFNRLCFQRELNLSRLSAAPIITERGDSFDQCSTQ